MRAARTLSLLLLLFCTVAGAAAADREKNSPLATLDQVIGMQVWDARGQKAGEIRDFIIDPASGRLRYAIVGGQSGSHFLPWEVLRRRQEGQEAQYMSLPITTEDIGKEPKRRPNMTDEDFFREIHQFYGVSPYWPAQPPEAEKARQQRKSEEQPR